MAEGTITADSGPIGLLLTYTPFADYQFRCDYKMAAGGNSGVFLRTLADPKDVQKDCYEVNIVDEHPSGFLTGAIVGLQKTAGADHRIGRLAYIPVDRERNKDLRCDRWERSLYLRR